MVEFVEIENKEFFDNKENITLYDIQNKCKIGKLNSEARSFIYKILLNILQYNNPKIYRKSFII